jgi:hypothetical protein
VLAWFPLSENHLPGSKPPVWIIEDDLLILESLVTTPELEAHLTDTDPSTPEHDKKRKARHEGKPHMQMVPLAPLASHSLPVEANPAIVRIKVQACKNHALWFYSLALHM